MVFIALWHLLVYCPLAHMQWHPDGLITYFGHKDFAGGLVVHMSSGFSALMLAYLVGPRRYSFNLMLLWHLLGLMLLWRLLGFCLDLDMYIFAI